MVDEDDRQCCPPDLFKRALKGAKNPHELDMNVEWITRHGYTFSDQQIEELDNRFEWLCGCNNE